VLCEEFLGIQLERRLTAQTVESLKGRLEARQEARRNKDWNLADRIRDEIAREGYAIEDTAQGPLLKPSSS
ncbi:MAG: cysteine--tRNA ligase, partial [Elusimicrobia bacterium]|nr:cysteine--tRNA ligase [Elusimicrobiota bacterium]